MNTSMRIAIELVAINGISGALGRVVGDLNRTGRATDQVRREFDLMNKSVSEGLKALALYGGLKEKLKGGINAAADLQESMLRVEGSIRTTTMSAADLHKQLQAVRDTAVDVSKSMPYSATQVVDIQNALLKAGVDPASVTGKRGAAWAASGLASLSESDPADVGDMLARIGKQYALKDDQYGRAADVLMKAEAASPGNLQEIMYSLRQFGGTASNLNIPLKDASALAAMATPLGLEAGTSINRFLEDSIGKTKMQRDALRHLGLGSGDDKHFKNAFFDHGQYIGADRATALVRERLNAIHDADVRQRLASTAWGEEGARFALLAARSKGSDSYQGMTNQMGTGLGIEDRMAIQMRGYNLSGKAEAGTVQSALARFFDPILGALTRFNNLKNDAADASIKFMGNHDTATNIASWLTAGAVGGVGLYGVGKLMQGGWHGAKLLRSLGSTAGGIAEGKAVEAATGVTPVFVTNWPASMGSGAAAALADVAGSALGGSAGGLLKKAPGVFSRLLTGGRLLLAAPSMATLAEFGTGAMAASAGMVGAAGLAGYGAGTLIHNSLPDTINEAIGRSMAKVFAFFGNSEAKAAVDADRKAQELNGTLHFKFDFSGSPYLVGVNTNSPGMKFNAYAGHTMVSP